MPRKSNKRVTEEDTDDSSVRNEERKPKKAKTEKSRKLSQAEEVPGNGARDDDGAEYWELTNNRRVTISEFRKKYMVNIREYYQKDDKMLPGKKGISLPVDQFAELVSIMPHIETVLKAKGEDLPRPHYSDTSDGKDEEKDGGNGSAKTKKGKRNFEATSDEGESEARDLDVEEDE